MSTIGADSRSARSSTSLRASRAPIPTSSVTLPAALIASAASFTSPGITFAGGAMNRGCSLGASRSPTSPGSVSTATPRSVSALWTARSSRFGSCCGLVIVARKTATSANSASLSTSWKKSVPSSGSGTWPQIASTGACDFLAS